MLVASNVFHQNAYGFLNQSNLSYAPLPPKRMKIVNLLALITHFYFPFMSDILWQYTFQICAIPLSR